MKKLLSKTLLATALALPVLAYAAVGPILFDTTGGLASGLVAGQLWLIG